jgi:hypothetical protein
MLCENIFPITEVPFQVPLDFWQEKTADPGQRVESGLAGMAPE